MHDFNEDSMLFSPIQESSTPLDVLFSAYQDRVVKDLAASLFSEFRVPEADTLWQAEGETLRELGWIQAMDTPPRHPPEIHQDNWFSVLSGLSGIRNPSMMHFMIQASADYLFHDGADSWLMVLVRSGSRIKDSYIAEAELNRWVFAQKGIHVKRTFLLSPRDDFARFSMADDAPLPDVEAQDYFQIHSLNHAIKHMQDPLSLALPRILTAAAENQLCSNQRTCPQCRNSDEKLPVHNIYTLHRGGKAVDLLEREGILDLAEISRATDAARSELKDRHHIQLKSIESGQAHIDEHKLANFLAGIRFPALFLDFESTSEAIPPISGSVPWEHVPFMYSTHRMEHADVDTQAAAESSQTYIMDPNRSRHEQIRTLAENLLRHAEGAASVLVYGAALESATLLRLSKLFPDLSEALLALRDKIVDIQTPFVQFWYYHPGQHGKFSLKKILPLLSEHSHQGLPVQSGGEANVNYYFLSNPKATNAVVRPLFVAETQAQWIESFKTYCAMDTFGLVQITRHLFRLANGSGV